VLSLIPLRNRRTTPDGNRELTTRITEGMTEYRCDGQGRLRPVGISRPDRRRPADGRIAFREVMNSRWLIVGFGAIGRETAKRARAFAGAHHRRDGGP
jgi:YD repeat-containing protein